MFSNNMRKTIKAIETYLENIHLHLSRRRLLKHKRKICFNVYLQVIRFKEIDGKDCTDHQAQCKIAEAAKETKALNELVKAGHAYAKTYK